MAAEWRLLQGLGHRLPCGTYLGQHAGKGCIRGCRLPVGIRGWFGNQPVESGGCQPQGALGCKSMSARALRGVTRFAQTDVAPSTPQGSVFRPAATTLRVPSTSASDVGNALLDFLETQMASSVTKVRRAQLSIKADVFVNGSMCTIKVHVRGEAGGTHAVEFQRHSGSCLAFAKVYRRAAQYLVAHLDVMNMPEGLADACHHPPILRGMDVGDVSVLLDLTQGDITPVLQAEAASCLVDIAAQEAAKMSTPHALARLKTLLQSDQEGVAYPAACALSALAQCSDVAPCIRDNGILPTIVDNLWSAAATSLVQRELRLALAGVVDVPANVSK